MVLETNILVPVNSFMMNVNLSIGIGAKFVYKYVAVPNPVTTKPIPKQIALMYHCSGVTKMQEKKPHVNADTGYKRR
ncbi:hypothetical protein CHCC20375_0799 [Bacillus licheniformis]|nr:hypothetical protein CHCC20375_0799 [Bacillus licheniformis]